MNTEKEFVPDFPPEDWSERDRFFIEPFATNPDGFVSVLHNLPPEIVGALCSRASRASGSLLRVLLNEYIYPILDGDNNELSKELEETIEFLRTRGFRNILNNQRAQEFYAKWLSQYGDDSIAQMTGTHVVFWGISQVAMKFIEDQRIGLEPIEKSTRYVNFGNKVGGKYLYYVPKPDLTKINLVKDYRKVLDNLFDTYVALQEPLVAWFKKNYEEKGSVIKKKAFDTLRGLLPMATLGQVAFRGNAQAWEYLINRTAKHHLGELRWIAIAVKTELDKEIPSLMLRASDPKSQEYQEYLAGKRSRVRDFLTNIGVNIEKPEVCSHPEVTLVEFDRGATEKILAGIIFPETHNSWEECLNTIKRLSVNKKKKLLETYLQGRTARWQKVGRGFENSYLRFEITMNIGAYRDLHRHRMMTQDRQRFSTYHGYDMPTEIKEAGLTSQFNEALQQADVLYRKIVIHDPDLAQYVVPFAYRIRFYQWENIRQFFWEAELRTIPQGHPDYRWIEQEKFRLVRNEFPILASAMLVDEKDYPFARRGTEENIKKKEKKIIERLKKKTT